MESMFVRMTVLWYTHTRMHTHTHTHTHIRTGLKTATKDLQEEKEVKHTCTCMYSSLTIFDYIIILNWLF